MYNIRIEGYHFPLYIHKSFVAFLYLLLQHLFSFTPNIILDTFEHTKFKVSSETFSEFYCFPKISDLASWTRSIL